jgi:Rrf2 family protein
MRLTHASSYALNALAHLAATGDGIPVASHHIARARGIPERFLLKVLRPLVSAQLVRSLKGPHGGYRLARPAAKVTVLEVVEAVDGPLRAEVPPVGDGNDGLDARLEEVCEEVADRVRRRLGKVYLADLAGRG